MTRFTTPTKPLVTRPRRCLLCVFACFLIATGLHAAIPSNRWLLIVETSRAMQSRRDASAQLAGNLILSGMYGQLRAGDSLGLWTFNSTLHSGEFPLQVWTPAGSAEIAQRVSFFLAMRPNEGRANFGAVLPAIQKLVSNSEYLTIILISSGSTPLRGTPYDDTINALQRRFQARQDKAEMPFVTVLRAHGGRIVDFTETMPPAPLDLPPLPPELRVTNTVAEKPPEPTRVETPPTQPPPIAPPLIVHGKKPEPETNPPVEVPAVAAPPVTTNEPAGPPTNVVAAITNLNTSPTQAVAPEAISAATNQSTTAAPTEPPRRSMRWVGGAIAGAAAVAILLILLLRSRKRDHTSLITRSLDRDQD